MARITDRKILSWCLYDFANSCYSAVIAAVVFPVYFANVIVGNESGAGDLWWGRAISLSMAFVALSSPVMGGIADFGGLRKRFLFAYTAICITAVSCFTFLHEGMAFQAFVLVVIANIGMEGAIVFYNSFLPEIAEREYQGRVSSWGFALGYTGSILSLLVALPLVKSGRFDATWLVVAGLFALASLPAFFFLPPDNRSGPAQGRLSAAAGAGLTHTWRAFKEVWSRRGPRRFLISYLIYEDGVNTVIIFSSIFAATTLGFSASELVGLYLVVQITALIGATVMSRPVDFWGPKKVVVLSLLLWVAVSVMSYFVSGKAHFWVVATVAGLGLGTVQAASRAFYAQFVPKDKESEYFGVYSLVGKTSAVAGPLVFGAVSSYAGSQRPAVLAVSGFFIAGLLLLRFVEGGGPNVTS